MPVTDEMVEAARQAAREARARFYEAERRRWDLREDQESDAIRRGHRDTGDYGTEMALLGADAVLAATAPLIRAEARREAADVLVAYRAAVRTMNSAMSDGLNVHGAVAELAAAEDDVDAFFALADQPVTPADMAD